MRIYGKKINVNEDKLLEFFNGRAEKYVDDSPEVTVLYQDSHPELAMQRDLFEKKKIIPMLEMNKNTVVLDIGCGIGRWLTAFNSYEKYLGTDFSPELITLAKKKYKLVEKAEFKLLSVQGIITQEKFYDEKFNTIILSGVIQYINDELLESLFEKLLYICSEKSIIYIRTSIGTKERLVLNEEWSPELGADYSAIYRTREECFTLFEKVLLNNKFYIKREGYMYEGQDELNNRDETIQYYFILKRD